MWFFSGHTVQSIRIYKKLCYFNRNQSECFHFSKVFFTALTNYSDKFTLSFLWSILIYKKLSSFNRNQSEWFHFSTVWIQALFGVRFDCFRYLLNALFRFNLFDLISCRHFLYGGQGSNSYPLNKLDIIWQRRGSCFLCTE